MSKRSIFQVLIILIVSGISAGFGQVLMKVSITDLDDFSEEKIWWSEQIGDLVFLVTPDDKYVQFPTAEITVLDKNVETGLFYWLEKDFGFNGVWDSVFESSFFTTLWHNNHTGIVRINSPDFINYLPEGVQLRRIYFSRVSPEHFYLQKNSPPSGNDSNISELFSNIISIDSIYRTERHLSGEESFYLNGILDSLTSRNSKNPQIFTAQKYIQSRLEDYGYSTELDPFSLATTLYDVQFTPGQSDTGWIAGQDKIYRTVDGGNTWTISYEGLQGSYIWSVFPFTGQKVFAAGGNGRIFMTSDGGINWTVRSPYSLTSLFGIFFISPDTGWVCGDNGMVMKTVDSGNSWVLQNSNTSQLLYKIFFTDQLNGWAVGQNGTIIHTSDGGATWLIQNSGVNSRLYGAYFLNPNTGFVVGWDGRVLRTVDSGNNWSLLPVPVNEYYYDIDFLDAFSGIIVGRNGTSLTTSDGGTSWQIAGNIDNRNAFFVDMVNNSVIWATGLELLAKSEDAGITWQKYIQNIPELFLNNIIATLTGTTHPDQFYILCAHYDDMPEGPLAPGADDNASGTAAVIEAARVMKDMNLKHSVRFILFSGEEQGLVGSASYAAKAAAAGDNILGVLNMDMIGYDGNGDGRMEIHAGNMTASQSIASVMLNYINTSGIALAADYKTSNSSRASDHASFWSVGYPAVMHIEDFEDFTPYYHTVHDRLSSLRREYFRDNAILAINSIIQLAQPDSSSTGIIRGVYPVSFQISEPYPNPFNPVVHLEYQVYSAGNFEADVFDLLGRRVKNLVSGRQRAGEYRISWNGTDERDLPLSSGVYLIRFSSDQSLRAIKVVLLR